MEETHSERMRAEHQPLEGENSERRRDIARGKKPMTAECEESPNDGSYDAASSEEENDTDDSLGEQLYTKMKSKISRRTPRDDSGSEYLAAMLSRGFSGTRFPHKHTMQSLGIYEDAISLFKAAYINDLMWSPSDAYHEETCHFLATLHHHEVDDGSSEFISFSVRGEVYAIMIEQLDELFGFPQGEAVDPNFSTKEMEALWRTIGNGKFKAGTTRGTSIRNPVIRYYHKSVANTIFGRNITGCINEGELGLINSGIKPFLKTTVDGKRMRGDQAQSSISRIMIKRMLGYKEWAMNLHKDGKQGTLTVGGIITPILRKCKVPLLSERCPPRWIEFNYLKKAGFFEGKREEMLYIFNHPRLGDSRILIPNIAATTIRERENICFEPEEDKLFIRKVNNNDELSDEITPERQAVSAEAELQEPECYYFDDFPKSRKDKSLAEVHKKLSKIQKWQKFQDKYIKNAIKDLTSQVKNLVSKVGKGSSSRQKRSPPQPSLMRSNSASTTREEPRAAQLPRHSSVDPETMQRRKRHHSAREDPGTASRLRFPQQQEEQEPEVPIPNLNYTAESMQEYLDATLFIPF